MDETNTRIKMMIGAIIMIALQVLLAPIITINSVIPNFLLAFTFACVAARPDQYHIVYSFVMGLIFDLITGGPVGSMALVMSVMSFVIALVLRYLPTQGFIVSILVIAVSIFVSNFFYGLFEIAIFMDASFVDLITYRILPCSIYDIIVAVILFPVMVRLIAPPMTGSQINNDYNINSR